MRVTNKEKLNTICAVWLIRNSEGGRREDTAIKNKNKFSTSKIKRIPSKI